MNESNLTIKINTSTIIKTVTILCLFALLFFLKDVAMVLLTSIILASAIDPGVNWFERKKIPRALGVILIYFALALVFFAVFFFILPTFLNETSTIVDNIPKYISKLSEGIPLLDKSFLEGYIPILNQISKEIGGINVSGFFDKPSGINGSNIFETARNVVESGLNFILVIVLSFYFAVTRDSVENFLRVITPSKNEEYILNLWARSKKKIGGWLQGQLMLACLMATLLYPVLAILGVKHALLLSILAGILELIPVFGSTLAAVPAVLLSLLDGGVTLAVLVLGYYLIVQQFEAHIFYPLVVKKIIGISPLVVIVSLVVGVKLAGVVGAILAIPLSVILVEYINDLDKRKINTRAQA